MLWMRNEQFGALLIQLQSTELSVRGSFSVSVRWSSSFAQVHCLVLRGGWSCDRLCTGTTGAALKTRERASFLLEGSQATPARPSGRNNVKVKTLW
jgi:hypothetical protein